LVSGAPAKDRALIAALQKRYSADPKAEGRRARRRFRRRDEDRRSHPMLEAPRRFNAELQGFVMR